MGSENEFSFKARPEFIQRLQSETFDILVIGGGITGTALARDAALRGLKVALIEAADFASGSSSGSTKLIHGGLRYLEQMEFKLVFEAIRERELLQKLYAPFVSDLSFVFPTYKNLPPPRWKLNIGLSLYDSFSYFRARHQNISKTETLKRFSFLKDSDLTGSCIYQDSFAEDYRLTVELAKAAHRHSAVVLNRVAAVQINPGSDSTTHETKVRDVLSQKEFVVRSKFIYNCSGPFSDQVRGFLKLKKALRLTQGVHFIVKKELFPIDSAFVFADPDQHRILFAIPWNSVTYFGTTDTSLEDPSRSQATRSDLDYCLSVLSRYFHHDMKAKDILQSWAAVRPLIAPKDDRANSSVSREHQIEESPKNIFHILGGKLTSHRLMAEEALDLIRHRIDLPPSKTHSQPLQDLRWTKSEVDRIERAHGFDVAKILEIEKSENLGDQKISSSSPHRVSEVLHSIRNEMAMSPLDFIRRRSSLYYEYPTHEIAELVTEIFSDEMDSDFSLSKSHLDEVTRAYEWDRTYAC